MHLHLRRINNLGPFPAAALPCGGFIPRRQATSGRQITSGKPAGRLDRYRV
jgi:hypothetical protein